jgi:hypothetical protein
MLLCYDPDTCAACGDKIKVPAGMVRRTNRAAPDDDPAVPLQ